MATLSGISSFYKLPDLRRRVIFTLLMLAVYRAGVFVSIPGVDRDALVDGLRVLAITASPPEVEPGQPAGKPFKVVMTACMRKLLVILNAMVSAGTEWSLSP